jgi:cell wall-associated NlpC family hydrolase
VISDEQRKAIVAEAKSWNNTPYHITAAVKQGGVDCAQLLYSVYSAVGLMPPMTFNYRSIRAYIAEKDPLFLQSVKKYADEIPETDVLPGDVVMYKNPAFAIYTHAAIVLEWPTVIHAVFEQGVVVTGAWDGFLRAWTRKVFRFRGQE